MVTAQEPEVRIQESEGKGSQQYGSLLSCHFDPFASLEMTDM